MHSEGAVASSEIQASYFPFHWSQYSSNDINCGALVVLAAATLYHWEEDCLRAKKGDATDNGGSLLCSPGGCLHAERNDSGAPFKLAQFCAARGKSQ